MKMESESKDMEMAKHHIDMAKEIVDKSGGDWDEFLDSCKMDSEPMGSGDEEGESESYSDSDEPEERSGDPKKAMLIIAALKKKKGM